MFLEVDRVTTRGNEFLVQVRPPNLVSEVGSPPQIRIPRRRFSAREDLVRRLYRRRAGDRIRGMWVLVTLAPFGTEGDQMSGRVCPDEDALVNTPVRPWRRLLDWAGSSDEIALVSVVGTLPEDEEQEGGVVVEARPGVFVRIPTSVVGEDAPRAGSVVAVVPTGDAAKPLRLVEALPSDLDVIPPHGRPVNVLPIDELARAPALESALAHGAWRDKRRFTVEGLPGVLAALPRATHPRDAVDLLQLDDPRPAWLTRSGDDLRVDPGGHQGAVVCISLHEGRNPKVHDLGSNGWAYVKWRELTCVERPAAEVSERIANTTWLAHDVTTVVWTAQATATRPELSPRTALTGPLYAEFEGEGEHRQPRLRYTPANIGGLALPPGAFTENMPGPKEPLVLPLAGADAGRGWLYVEIVPGRVAVLPLRQLVHREGPGAERALGDLAASSFGPGDELTLTLAPSDPLSVDRVRLVGWTPGVRPVFGGRPALLPLGAVDPDAGALKLGAGAWTLILPASRDEIDHRRFKVGDLVILGSENALRFPRGLRAAMEELRDAGGVVLLVAEGDRLMIAGCPQLEVRPDPRRESWEGDPLAGRLTSATAARVVEAAGGALPVLVTGVDQQAVYVSRGALGRPAWRPGDRLPARVLGSFSHTVALVRVGGQVMPVPHDALVAGVEEGRTVSAGLAESRALVWLHADPDGALRPGLDPSVSTETSAEVLFPVSEAAGFVCRDIRTRALHWLPAQLAAWADLTPHMGDFASHAGIVRAMVTTNGGLSVVGLPSAEAEFEGLQVGAETVIEPIRDGPEGLARTSGSRIWLAIDGPAPERRAMTVVRIRDVGRQRRIRVAPPGSWCPVVDLPWVRGEHGDLDSEILGVLDRLESRDWAGAADALDRLARRAVRALPAEVLLATWLTDPSVRGATDGVYGRLRMLLPRTLGSDQKKNEEIRQTLYGNAIVFCRAAEVRRSQFTESALLDIAAAWRAALGQDTPGLDRALERASLLGALLAVTWPRLTTPGLPVGNELAGVLRHVRHQLREAGFKVELGVPLPLLRRA